MKLGLRDVKSTTETSAEWWDSESGVNEMENTGLLKIEPNL